MLSDRISGSFSLFSPGPPVLPGRKPGVLAKPLPQLEPASLLLTVPRRLPHPLCADAPPFQDSHLAYLAETPPLQLFLLPPHLPDTELGSGCFPGRLNARFAAHPSHGLISSLLGVRALSLPSLERVY